MIDFNNIQTSNHHNFKYHNVNSKINYCMKNHMGIQIISEALNY